MRAIVRLAITPALIVAQEEVSIVRQ